MIIIFRPSLKTLTCCINGIKFSIPPIHLLNIPNKKKTAYKDRSGAFVQTPNCLRHPVVEDTEVCGEHHTKDGA